MDFFPLLYGFFRESFSDATIVFFAEYFGWILLSFLIVFLFTHRHTKKEGMRNIAVIILSAVAAWAVAQTIKYFLYIPRPYEELTWVDPLFFNGSGDSFPSGHATFFGALAAAVFLHHRVLGLLFAAGALAIGAARVAAGVHFPEDIIAGFAIGAGVAYFCYKFYHLRRKAHRTRPLRPY